MFGSLLRTLALVRLGASAKNAVSSGLRQAAWLLVGSLLIIAGCIFGLIAIYHSLLAAFAPGEAAGILAAALLLPGLGIFAIRSIARERASAREHDRLNVELDDPAETIRQGATSLTRKIGPTNVIALALMLGMAAGRKVVR